MATESPIRLLEAQGKWVPHNEEMYTLSGHKYMGHPSTIIPHRSGSAPPNMEGSLAAIGTLMHKSGLRGSHFHQCFSSGFDQHVLSRSSLSTHKEESEDDRSPQKSCDDLSEHESSSSKIKDDLTCMSSTTSGPPSASHHGPDVDRPDSHDGQTSSIPEKSTLSVHIDHSTLPVFKQSPNNSHQTSFPSIRTDDPKNMGSVPNITSIQSGLKAMKLAHPPNLDQQRNQVEWQNNIQTSFVQYPLHQPLHEGKLSLTEPLYASYMHPLSPYYASYQPSGVVYPPHYGVGGYPYFGGYPPYNGSGSDVGTPVSWVSAAEDVDMGHINNFYGPHGFAQPFVGPCLQFHQSFGDLCNVPGQVDPLAFRRGFQNQVANASQKTGEITGTNFTASPMDNAWVPLPSPVLPGSVTIANNIPRERTDVGFPNWQGQRGFERFNQQRSFTYLEELKSGKSRRFDLCDIVGHMVEFSVDQHGSRFIQQKLEHCSSEEKAYVFQEILPYASKLMTDVFGNYVIQKFFEYGTPDQRKHLAYALKGQVVPLSLQMYGCRVIQKALDVIEVEQKIELVRELDGHVMRCVRDQNGNHVIQKCIGCVPTDKIGFIVSAFRGQVANLSVHPYGCRVIQRVLEYCADELQTEFIVDEILESVCDLAQDQYGNYVTQHVLERGKPRERNQIIRNLSGKVVKMSQHKFASNVIEKCLEYADDAGRELLIGEVIGLNEGNDNLLVMMKDQYANYVVQKILEKCTDAQRDSLLGRVRVHLNGLKKYTYGKHIVARFEQLFGELEPPES